MVWNERLVVGVLVGFVTAPTANAFLPPGLSPALPSNQARAYPPHYPQGGQWPASSYSRSSSARSLSILDGGELKVLIDRQRELSRQHRMEEEEQEMFMEDEYEEDSLDGLLQEAEDYSIQEDDMAPEEAVVLLERLHSELDEMIQEMGLVEDQVADLNERLNTTAVKHLVAQVRLGLRDFPVETFVAALKAVSGVGYDLESDDARFLTTTESVLYDRIGEIHEPDALVAIMRSLWLLNHRPIVDSNRLCEAVSMQALRHIDDFRPESIATIAHAMAMLKVEEQEEHSRRLRVLISELKETGQGLTTEMLYPPLYTKKTGYFLDGLVDEAEAQINQFTPKELGMLMLGLASLNYRPPDDFLEVFMSTILSKLDGMSCNDLADVLGGLCMMCSLGNVRLTSETIMTLARAVNEKSPEANAKSEMIMKGSLKTLVDLLKIGGQQEV